MFNYDCHNVKFFIRKFHQKEKKHIFIDVSTVHSVALFYICNSQIQIPTDTLQFSNMQSHDSATGNNKSKCKARHAKYISKFDFWRLVLQ